MDVKTSPSFNGGLADRTRNRRDVRPKLTGDVRHARTRRHAFVPSAVHRFCEACGLSPTYPIHASRWPRPRRKVAP